MKIFLDGTRYKNLMENTMIIFIYISQREGNVMNFFHCSCQLTQRLTCILHIHFHERWYSQRTWFKFRGMIQILCFRFANVVLNDQTNTQRTHSQCLMSRFRLRKLQYHTFEMKNGISQHTTVNKSYDKLPATFLRFISESSTAAILEKTEACWNIQINLIFGQNNTC